MMVYMRPTFAQGKKTAISKLLELRRQAQKDKEPRVGLRIQGDSDECGRTHDRRDSRPSEGASQYGSAVDRSMEPVRQGRLTGGTSQRASDRSQSGGPG